MYFLYQHIVAPLLVCLCLCVLISCEDENTINKSSSSAMMCDRVGYILEGGECVINVGLDTDFDGVPNAVDNCVDVSNSHQEDCDQDGVGDLCSSNSLCGVSVSGFFKLLTVEDLTPIPYAHAPFEIEGVPSFGHSDDLGQYQLRNLSVGEHQLLIYSPNLMSETQQPLYTQIPAKVFRLQIDERDLSGPIIRDWIVNPRGNLGGRVLIADDNPSVPSPIHGNVGVYLEEIPFARVITRPAGNFYFSGVPEGSYTLKIVKEGYKPLKRSVEVIGLITQNLTQNPIILTPDQESGSWRQKIEVVIREASKDLSSVRVTLTPLFPHQTKSKEVVLTDVEMRKEGLVFSTSTLTHALHDVFDVSVKHEDIEGSRTFNVGAVEDELVNTELRGRGVSQNPYVIRDQDYDGIPDEEDEDRDNDGCFNINDVDPDDPFICTTIGVSPTSCGHPDQSLTPVNCQRDGDEDATCVLNNHCECSEGFVCNSYLYTNNERVDEELRECLAGDICVPLDYGAAPTSCGSFFNELAPIDCTEGGDQQADCVNGHHCLCSSPEFTCQTTTNAEDEECIPGSTCVPVFLNTQDDTVDIDTLTVGLSDNHWRYYFNNRTGRLHDNSNLFIGLIGKNWGEDSHCKVVINTSTNIGTCEALVSTRMTPEPIEDLFYSLEQVTYVDLPAIHSVRIFFSVNNKLVINKVLDAAQNVGFVAPNLADDDDPNIDFIFDFFEFTTGSPLGDYDETYSPFSGNTTQVDSFAIPLKVKLYSRDGSYSKVGVNAHSYSRATLFQEFGSDAPPIFNNAFPDLIEGNTRIHNASKSRLIQQTGSMASTYFDAAIESLYATTQPFNVEIPNWGMCTGEVTDDLLTFTCENTNQTGNVSRPTTEEVLLCSGALGQNDTYNDELDRVMQAQVCAAFHRGVIMRPEFWGDESKYYVDEPYNYYSKFWHEHSYGRKAYGFAYDEVYNQSTLIHSETARVLEINIHW